MYSSTWREGERETSVCCSTYLCVHWSVPERAPAGLRPQPQRVGATLRPPERLCSELGGPRGLPVRPSWPSPKGCLPVRRAWGACRADLWGRRATVSASEAALGEAAGCSGLRVSPSVRAPVRPGAAGLGEVPALPKPEGGLPGPSRPQAPASWGSCRCRRCRDRPGVAPPRHVRRAALPRCPRTHHAQQALSARESSPA